MFGLFPWINERNQSNIYNPEVNMRGIFNYVNPSDCNIKAQWLINFAKRLEDIDLPIHSITVRNDDI